MPVLALGIFVASLAIAALRKEPSSSSSRDWTVSTTGTPGATTTSTTKVTDVGAHVTDTAPTGAEPSGPSTGAGPAIGGGNVAGLQPPAPAVSTHPVTSTVKLGTVYTAGLTQQEIGDRVMAATDGGRSGLIS